MILITYSLYSTYKFSHEEEEDEQKFYPKIFQLPTLFEQSGLTTNP
jgi:hypothetical protein